MMKPSVLQRPMFATKDPVGSVVEQGAKEGAGLASLINSAQQSAAQESTNIGAQLAQNTMAGLDQAEDFKGMIDSLRGNEAPIQERYQELANFVGPEDAQQTPESVLAMVQPTIMMTQEGAASSGIAELIQDITGSVEMEMESGAPTPMGEGIGSMLRAGQPVQGFAAGGEVQYLSNGGPSTVGRRVSILPGTPNYSAGLASAVGAANPLTNVSSFLAPIDPGQNVVPESKIGSAVIPSLKPSTITQSELKQRGADGPLSVRKVDVGPAPKSELMDQFKERKEVYQEALGVDPEERKRESQSRILFDIANRALAFGSGVDPRTGQNMANRPMGAQLSAALQGAPEVISEELLRQRTEKRALDAAALASAERAEDARIQAAREERKTDIADARSVASQFDAFDFQQGENERTRDYQARLQTQRLQAEAVLQDTSQRRELEKLGVLDGFNRRLAVLNDQIQKSQIMVNQENALNFLGAQTEDRKEVAALEGEIASNLSRQDFFQDKQRINASAIANIRINAVQNAFKSGEAALDRALQITMQDKTIDANEALQQARLDADEELTELRAELSQDQQDDQQAFLLDMERRREGMRELELQIRKAEGDRDYDLALQLERQKNDLAAGLQLSQQQFLYGQNALDRDLRYKTLFLNNQNAYLDRLLQSQQIQTRADIDTYKANLQAQSRQLGRLGSGPSGLTRQMISSPEFLQQYAAGTLGEEGEQLFKTLILEYAGPQTTFDDSGNLITKPGTKLTEEVQEILAFRDPELYNQIYKKGVGFVNPYLYDPKQGGPISSEIAAQDPVAAAFGLPIYGKIEKDGSVNNYGIAPMQEPAFPIPAGQFDLSSAVGVRGAFTSAVNTFSDMFNERLSNEEAAAARATMVKLNQQILTLAEAALPGRPTNLLIETFQKLVPDPNILLQGTAATALNVRTLYGQALQLERTAATSLNNTAVSAKTREAAVQTINSVRPIIATLGALEQASRQFLDTPSPFATSQLAGQGTTSYFRN